MGQTRDRRRLQQHGDGFASLEQRERSGAHNDGGAAAGRSAASGGKGDGKGQGKGQKSYAAAAAAGGSGKGGGKGGGDKRPISWECFKCRIAVDSRGNGPCPFCSKPCPPHIRNWGQARPIAGGGGPTKSRGGGSASEVEVEKLHARIRELEKAAKPRDETTAADGEAEGDAEMEGADASTKTALAEAQSWFQKTCQGVLGLKHNFLGKKAGEWTEDQLEMDPEWSLVFGHTLAIKRAARLAVEDLRKAAFSERPLEFRLRKKREQVGKANDKHKACGLGIVESKLKREDLVKQLEQCDAGLAAAAVRVTELKAAAEALQTEFDLLEAGGGLAEASEEDDDELGTGCIGAVPKAAGAPPPVRVPKRGTDSEKADWQALVQESGYASFTEMCVAWGAPDPEAPPVGNGVLALAAPPPAAVLGEGEKSTKNRKRDGGE